MPSERVALRREQETMLMTLYLHARDADSKHPVLGDRYAAPVLNRIDYDFKRLKSLSGNQPVIVARAKAIDDIARAFLERHEEAVVLHLGCGLDSRVQRLDPGPGVAWYDVDQQPVIDLRRRLIDTRPGTTMLATSVTDTSWWSEIPDDRPTLVIGEGLLMYISPDDVAAPIDAALSRPVPTQTFVFDTVAPWVMRASKWQTNFRTADTKFVSTTQDLSDAFARHQGITLSEERSVVSLARQATPGPLGAVIAAVDALPAGHRAMVIRTYV